VKSMDSLRYRLGSDCVVVPMTAKHKPPPSAFAKASDGQQAGAGAHRGNLLDEKAKMLKLWVC